MGKKDSAFRDAKLRISERKAKKRRKFLCIAFPSASKFDEVKVANKRVPRPFWRICNPSEVNIGICNADIQIL